MVIYKSHEWVDHDWWTVSGNQLQAQPQDEGETANNASWIIYFTDELFFMFNFD